MEQVPQYLRKKNPTRNISGCFHWCVAPAHQHVSEGIITASLQVRGLSPAEKLRTTREEGNRDVWSKEMSPPGC